MKWFTRVTSDVIHMPMDNIDTDQIIPSRFLKITDKAGLADGLFADWRYEADGTPRAEFVLNNLDKQDARILLAGDNFGCGSSREHAPWALFAWGIEAVISTSFADIFFNNALKNGLLPIKIGSQDYALLSGLLEEDEGISLTVDLGTQRIILPDGNGISFPMDHFSKQLLLYGFDELGYILSFHDLISAHESVNYRGFSA